jgi:imidazolonepropionase
MHIEADRCVIKNLGRVATCADGVAPLTDDPAIAIEDGRVAYIGPASGLPKAFASATRIDGFGALLTPGLIDCHTHPAFVRARAEEFAMRLAGASYEEIAAKGGGIVNTTRSVREADDETLLAQTTRNLERLRRHGVVVAEGKSGYGLSLEHELRQLQAIRDAAEASEMFTIRTCLAAHSLPLEHRGDDAKREEYLKLVCDEILPAAAKDGLAQRADVFCEKGVFTTDEALRVGQAAKAAGLRVTVHAEQLHPSGGARVASELGADSADHLEYLDRDGMTEMAKAGVSAVLLPGSTHVLKMDKWADGRAMIDSGLNVALATDFNPGSSPIANPAFVMNLAVMRCGLTPDEALLGFTRNAARALRLDDTQWGCIQPGSRAAFALWDVDHEHELPYYAGSNLCREVITCRGWQQ